PIERGIAIIEPPPAKPNCPARSLDGQVNGKHGQKSNACVYIVAGHQINPPHKEGAHGIQAELPSRPGRATESSTRTHRGKTKKKGGEGRTAQSRARGGRSPAGCEANDRAALRVTGSAKHRHSCAKNVCAIAFGVGRPVHLYATAKSLDFDIDYKGPLREFQSRGDLLRALHYTDSCPLFGQRAIAPPRSRCSTRQNVSPVRKTSIA